MSQTSNSRILLSSLLDFEGNISFNFQLTRQINFLASHFVRKVMSKNLLHLLELLDISSDECENSAHREILLIV